MCGPDQVFCKSQNLSFGGGSQVPESAHDRKFLFRETLKKTNEKSSYFRKYFWKFKTFRILDERRLRSVVWPSERKQGPKGCQKRSEKHFCESHAKFEMDRLVGDSNLRDLIPLHLSLSNNSFDASPARAFVRSVTGRLLKRSSSRLWKFWIFKNIFENTNFISMVFFNVSRRKNFLP